MTSPKSDLPSTSSQPRSQMGSSWTWMKAWVPPAFWAAILFTLSAIPGHRFPSVHFSFSDKIVHAGIYGVLGALSFRGLRLTTRLSVGAAIVGAALLSLGYGITDEVHQLFVPNRSCDVMDGIADLLGGMMGALVASRLAWMRGRTP